MRAADNEYRGNNPNIPVVYNGLPASEFWTQVSNSWPRSGPASLTDEFFELIAGAIRAHPHSANLWAIMGDLLQAVWHERTWTHTAIECYQRALECDPLAACAYTEIGHLLNIESDPAAEEVLKAAIKCGSDEDAFIALAKVYSEQGRIGESSAILEKAHQAYSQILEKISAAQTELQNGEL